MKTRKIIHCPNCGGELAPEIRRQKEVYKGKNVLLIYKIRRYNVCNSTFVDMESFDKAWTRVREEVEALEQLQHCKY